MPIQHISNEILKKMNRKGTKRNNNKCYRKNKKSYTRSGNKNNINSRFSRETSEEFNELYKFVEKTKFDKLGCIFIFQKKKEHQQQNFQNKYIIEQSNSEMKQ